MLALTLRSAVAAADRIDQDRVLVVELAGLEPGRKYGVPSLVVGARGELRDVVDRAIGLDPAELAKVVDRMAAIGRAAADADQEQASLALPQAIKLGGQSLDRRERDLLTNLRGRSEEGFRMVHTRAPRLWRNSLNCLPHPVRHLKSQV